MSPLRTLVALAAVSLATASCGTLTTPAATVDGDAISEERLRDELDGAAAFAVANPGQGVDDFLPDDRGNWSMLTTRVLLSELILEEALGGSDVTVTDDDRAAAEALVPPTLNATPWLEAFLDRQAMLNAVARAEAADLGLPTSAEEWYEANRDGLVCARHLLVDTEEAAVGARSRVVDDGEDFGVVAGEVSLDTGSAAVGGDLGCGPAAQFVEPFGEAVLTQPIGEVGEPVETSFGFHVIVVDARGEGVAFADVADIAEQAYLAELGDLPQRTRTEVLAGADVDVDARYGTWDDDILQVVAEGPVGGPVPLPPPER